MNTVASILPWRGRTLALLCLAGFLALRAFDPVPFEPLRNALFDTLQISKPRAWQDLPVIIVDIDERSLAQFGQWPWPRNLVADLIDRISATGPLAIGIDILFSEPDRYSPNRVLDNFPDIDPRLKSAVASLTSNDTRLAQSLARAPTVLGIGALQSTAVNKNTRPVKPIPVVEHGKAAKSRLIRFPTALQSIPELDDAAKSRAALNVLPESDGFIRRVPLVVDIGGVPTPTLTLEMLRVAVGAPYFALHRDAGGITGIAVADVFVPTEPDGRIWINYGPPRAERYV